MKYRRYGNMVLHFSEVYMSAVLKITIVGKSTLWLVLDKLQYTSIPISNVNHINDGILGNLTTLTYAVMLDESSVIEKRREIINALMEEREYLMPMYVCGDWMHIWVFKRQSPIKHDTV